MLAVKTHDDDDDVLEGSYDADLRLRLEAEELGVIAPKWTAIRREHRDAIHAALGYSGPAAEPPSEQELRAQAKALGIDRPVKVATFDVG